MQYMETREVMCDICHKMWQLGWVAANDGNLSVRLPNGNFLATPTGISKSFITPEKLVVIDADGNVLEAENGYRPSSEIKMHLRCYKEREDVGAVLHAHPPTATGYAVAHVPLDRYTMIETVAAIGSIPVTPYGLFAGARCTAFGKPRRADCRRGRDHRLLPHGNAGAVRQDQPDGASAGRGKGDLRREYPEAHRPAQILRHHGPASGL